ncbi:MAG: hypothetical protein WD270_09980 [Acetobacterales bacterium]
MILDGCRVLVVDDCYLIATTTGLMLESAGCCVVGPYGRLDHALSAARTSGVDAALLDVKIRGQFVFPVAAVLEERDIPFAFVTRGDKGRVKAVYPLRPIITRPITERALCAFLAAA